MRRPAGFLACGSALLLASMAPAGDEEQALDAALQKISRLEATLDAVNSRLAQLEQEDEEAWLDESRAAQIRGVVLDVLADAETRASYASDGALAGYDPGKGFFLQSADGNYYLRVSGQIQARYVLNRAEDPGTFGANGPAEYKYGFQMRRVKITFSGNVVDPSWTYKLQGAFNRGANNKTSGNTSTFLVEDAWINKDLGDGFSVKVGQFKAPWMQEDLVGSSRQLAVERSLLAGYFEQNYNRGAQIQWQSEQLRLRGWTGNGIPTPFAGDSHNVTSSNWNTDPTVYSFVARGEAKFGDAAWKDFEDFNSFRGGKTGVMLGISGLYQRYATSEVFGDANATLVSGVTADVTVNFGGASLFSYVIWESGQDAETFPGNQPLGTRNPWGFLVQGGYFITDDVELFTRYEYGSLDASGSLMGIPYADNDLSAITAGFNWFFAKNALKFTLDYGISLNTLGRPAYGFEGYGSNSGAGYREDVPGGEYQWSLRAQMQLLF